MEITIINCNKSLIMRDKLDKIVQKSRLPIPIFSLDRSVIGQITSLEARGDEIVATVSGIYAKPSCVSCEILGDAIDTVRVGYGMPEMTIVLKRDMNSVGLDELVT